MAFDKCGDCVYAIRIILRTVKGKSMDKLWILAQADSNDAPTQVMSEQVTSEGEAIVKVPDANDAAGDQHVTPRSPWLQYLPLVLLFVLMYMILLRGPRKKQQEHKQMVQSLAKNDKVRTIGGIIGTVVDIKDDEVVLKVDESNNTKIKVSKSAIGRTISSESS